MAFEPLVSIVMPVYNPPEERFKHCIESILSQTYGHFELILVDDGSDESTKCTIEKLSNTDRRIRRMGSGHRGPAAARNIGTKASQGSYITYVDSDDALPNYTLERMVAVATQHNAQVAFGLYQKVRTIEDEQPAQGSSHQLTEKEIEELLDYTLGGSIAPFYYNGKLYDVLIGPVASIVDASLAKDLTFPENVFVSEDTLWMISLVRSAKTIAISYDTWYWRWLNEGSLAHSFQPGIYENAAAFMKELKLLREAPGRELKNELILARDLGEINRVAKNYARPEWGAADAPKKRDLRNLLKEESVSDLLTFQNTIRCGFRTAVKVLLIKTNLVIPYWRYALKKNEMRKL